VTAIGERPNPYEEGFSLLPDVRSFIKDSVVGQITLMLDIVGANRPNAKELLKTFTNLKEEVTFVYGRELRMLHYTCVDYKDKQIVDAEWDNEEFELAIEQVEEGEGELGCWFLVIPYVTYESSNYCNRTRKKTCFLDG
jgi:hypothetical protein